MRTDLLGASASIPLPYWLRESGAESAVVPSTRVRWMRNLRGYRFPMACEEDELIAVQSHLAGAIEATGRYARLDFAHERDRSLWVGLRLLSFEFDPMLSGRSVFVDRDLSTALLVNEEDHLRVQSVTPGWSLDHATSRSLDGLSTINSNQFARSRSHGYLASSVLNCGDGVRISAMLHLIGLAAAKRLSSTLRALTSEGITARGWFGESTKASGAFVQLSVTAMSRSTALSGAVRYAVHAEHEARRRHDPPPSEILLRSTEVPLSLNDSLKVLSYLRWGAQASGPAGLLMIDRSLAELPLSEGEDADMRRMQLVARCARELFESA